MDPISTPVVKKDHEPKMSGRSIYVGDYAHDGILEGKILRSTIAKGTIEHIDLPELPEGYYYVDYHDVPGENRVAVGLGDLPVYSEGRVEFIGDAIGMFVGPDKRVLDKLVAATHITYNEETPELDVTCGTTVFYDYHYGKGDVDKAFEEADKIYEEVFDTGYQEQAYIEPQGMMAEPEPDGHMWVHGSMQCIYYVKGALMKALGCGPAEVHVMQDVTGGGFGGKESYPSTLGCQVAVAAHKVGAPVRCIFDRREDLEVTPKRHPSHNTYRAAIKDGRVTAMDIDVIFNSGAYSTLSAVVLQRGLICSDGVYNIENLRVRGRAIKTNTVPNGAYRGFGAPQTYFSVEMLMNHIARDLGEDSLEFKERHLVKQGDWTSTSGKYHFRVPLPDMIAQVCKDTDYRRKHKEYAKPQTGRYRRGIGMSLYFHGAGFTGSGERDVIKAVAKLHKYPDGTVEVLASNGEIGQGLRTTFPKIVAHELNIPLDKVYYNHPDTARVPDSGPTVASRSLMIVGELLRRAAIKLRTEWKEGEDQLVEEHYKEPDFMIPFDLATFHGDAYPTYAWGLHCLEVEVDTYTGLTRIVDAQGAFDVGTPIDYNVVLGQMEGGFLQGIGYGSIEKMYTDEKGRLRNNNFSDYLIPTSNDVPNLTATLHVEKFPEGPYGAKGAGEVPLVGGPPAYLEAIEQALGCVNMYSTPCTAEDIMNQIMKGGN
jgi:CO/xanthine dehydrogenase Mo-binding subunit